MVAWNVYLGRKCIDTVFFMADCDKEHVLRSLINHDGYDSNIRVTKARK